MKRTVRKFLLGGLALLMAAGVMAGPGRAAEGDRVLVAYFSWSGNTRKIAEELHRRVGGDLVEIRPERPYSTDYSTCLDEARRDQAQNARPALRGPLPDMSRYDLVFLGAPNWWSSIPMPVATFLENAGMEGKTIAPFISHGGGGFARTVRTIEELCPGSVILRGLAVASDGGSSLGAMLDQWLEEIGSEFPGR